jgi:F0F1-type ATP synthase assembly protein I
MTRSDSRSSTKADRTAGVDRAKSEQSPHQGEIQHSSEGENGGVREFAPAEARREIQLPGKRRLKRIAHSSNSQQASAYQGAAEAGFAIVIATLLGYWADSHFGTTPRYLIAGAIIGFGSMVLRLFRMRSLFEEPLTGDETSAAIPNEDERADDTEPK